MTGAASPRADASLSPAELRSRDRARTADCPSPAPPAGQSDSKSDVFPSVVSRHTLEAPTRRRSRAAKTARADRLIDDKVGERCLLVEKMIRCYPLPGLCTVQGILLSFPRLTSCHTGMTGYVYPCLRCRTKSPSLLAAVVLVASLIYCVAGLAAPA